MHRQGLNPSWHLITSAHWIREALNRANCLMLAVIFMPSFGNTHVETQKILRQDLGVKLNCMYFRSAILSSLELCRGLWSFHSQERDRKELQSIWGDGVTAPSTSASNGVRDLWEHAVKSEDKVWTMQLLAIDMTLDWYNEKRLVSSMVYFPRREKKQKLDWNYIFICSVHPEIKTIGNH